MANDGDDMVAAFNTATNVLRAAGLAHLGGDELAGATINRLFGIGIDSEYWAEEMLRLTDVDDRAFWNLFHTCWSDCDDTWVIIWSKRFRSHANDPARSRAGTA